MILILLAAAYQIDNIAAYAFVVGYASHSILDMFTPMGVALFAPFSSERYSLANIKTGGFAEPFAVALIVCVSIVFASFFNEPVFGEIKTALTPLINETQDYLNKVINL